MKKNLQQQSNYLMGSQVVRLYLKDIQNHILKAGRERLFGRIRN